LNKKNKRNKKNEDEWKGIEVNPLRQSSARRVRETEENKE